MNTSNQKPETVTGTEVGGEIKFQTSWGWMESHPGEVMAKTAQEALEKITSALLADGRYWPNSPYRGEWSDVWKGERWLVTYLYWGDQEKWGNVEAGEEGVDWESLTCRVRPNLSPTNRCPRQAENHVVCSIRGQRHGVTV